jgi:CheY-like chemotaxis protein
MNSDPNIEPSGNTKAPVVLVVEDDPLTRKMIGRRLQGAGYEVILVENAGDALIIAQREVFQVLVLDLHLVNTDPFGGIHEGFGVLDWLRHQIGELPFRVVIHTSQTGRHLLEKAESRGVFAYCAKRRDLNNLVQCVGEAVASLKAA